MTPYDQEPLLYAMLLHHQTRQAVVIETIAKLLYGNSFGLPLNSSPRHEPPALAQIPTFISVATRQQHQTCQCLLIISPTPVLSD